MSEQTDHESRLQNLEVKLGFAQHHIEELDAVIAAQQTRIDLLKREIEALRNAVRTLAEKS
jgi:uncharacterized coiled-coil protein SlyX